MKCVADINFISTLFEKWYGEGGLFQGDFGKVTNSSCEYKTSKLFLTFLEFLDPWGKISN